MPDKIIKKFNLGTEENENLYDIAAKYLQDGNNVITWAEIKEMIEFGLDIVVLQTLPEANAQSYATYHNKFVFVPKTGEEPDKYNEYVIQRNGSGTQEDPYTYRWEHIGSTDVDLTDYAKWGIYASGVPSSNQTSADGAATITTTEAGGGTATGDAELNITIPVSIESAGAQNAEGTATVTYKKSSNQTQETGSTATADTSESDDVTIQGGSFEFNGTEGNIEIASVNVPVKIDKHVYQPAGSIGGSAVVPKHSHTVNEQTVSVVGEITFTANSLPTRETFEYVNGVKASGGTANAITELTVSTQTFVTEISAPTTSVFNGATVNNSGVLTFNATPVVSSATVGASTVALTSVGAKTTKTVILNTGLQTASAYQITGVGTQASLTQTPTTVLKTGTTISEQASVTIQGASFTFTGTTATLGHTQAATSATLYNELNSTIPALSTTYTPQGTIGGSVTIAGHSHKYVSLPAHTHGITLTDTTITGTAKVSVASHTHGLSTTVATFTGTVSVAISGHTHQVTVASHTHSLGNHTHNVEVSPANRTPLPTPTV